ncbi:CGNR zinc finger domain-containing protein [Nitriliruptoraceae bacterium ZYF776]|nr:CGNR zinc finger domain-containing protein [Profundirhabdus halotolerans]
MGGDLGAAAVPLARGRAGGRGRHLRPTADPADARRHLRTTARGAGCRCGRPGAAPARRGRGAPLRRGRRGRPARPGGRHPARRAFLRAVDGKGCNASRGLRSLRFPEPEVAPVAFDPDDRSAQLAALLADAARDHVDLATLQARLADADLGHLAVDEDDLPDVHALGAELDAAFGLDDAATVTVVDGLLADLRVRPRLSTHDGRPPHLHFERDGAGTVERLRANTVLGLARTVTADGPDRLGRCDADGCARVFVDTSRNGRRRFCTTACANRTHVAAHRARRR